MSIKDVLKGLSERIRPAGKDITELWQLFERGKDHNNVRNLKANCEAAYRFYEGDQWHGLDVEKPQENIFQNFIEPTVTHKLANVCMNEMAVVFEGDDEEICRLITDTVGDLMKKIRIHQAGWEAVEAALVSGNGYVFFPCGDICISGAKVRGHKTPWQLIDSPCIFFGDEQTDDIQSQPYIIIYERKNVEDVRRMAAGNKIPEEEIEKIRRDEELDLLVTTDTEEELQAGVGKCSSIIFMEKREGKLHVARSTKHVIYEPLHPLCGSNELGEAAPVGMDMYPLAGIIFGRKKNSSRGRGAVLPMISNQIEYNKNLVRMAATVKNTAFPKVAYARDMIDNPESLSEVGAMIAVDSGQGMNEVSRAVGYIQPTGISADAMHLNSILKDGTRELMNAGQAVTGEIDPEKASGSAIIAMRDQAAIPLNKLQSAFKRLYADMGMILFHYLIAYNPAGLQAGEEGRLLTQQELQEADVSINVEVTSIAPYSVFARDAALEKLLQAGAITFEEYVAALDENSTVPKKILSEILAKRGEAQAVAQVQERIDEVAAEGQEQELLAQMAEKRLQEIGSAPTEEEAMEAELADIMGGGEVNE